MLESHGSLPSELYTTPDEQLAKAKKEFAEASQSPGLHFNHPGTPIDLILPGGIGKFRNIHFDMTLREDMKTVTLEWFSTARKEAWPLLEIIIDQYKPGCLNYSLDDYETRSYGIPDPNFKFTIGKKHIIKLHYDTKDSYLVVFIDGAHGLFECLERFEAGLIYDRVRIRGAVNIEEMHVPCDDLPLPLTVPVARRLSEQVVCEIKAKKLEHSKEMAVVVGQTRVPLSLESSDEDIDIELIGAPDGATIVIQDEEEVAVVPAVTGVDTIVIEGDVDISWVESGRRTDSQPEDDKPAKDGAAFTANDAE